MKYARGHLIALLSLSVAVVSCLAALAVVPEVRALLGLHSIDGTHVSYPQEVAITPDQSRELISKSSVQQQPFVSPVPSPSSASEQGNNIGDVEENAIASTGSEMREEGKEPAQDDLQSFAAPTEPIEPPIVKGESVYWTLRSSRDGQGPCRGAQADFSGLFFETESYRLSAYSMEKSGDIVYVHLRLSATGRNGVEFYAWGWRLVDEEGGSLRQRTSAYDILFGSRRTLLISPGEVESYLLSFNARGYPNKLCFNLLEGRENKPFHGRTITLESRRDEPSK